jgi:hypothetical protein
MDAPTFITRIREAGFDIHLADGNLAISPASRLDDEQRQWIKANKAAIVATLRVPGTLLDSGQGGHDIGPANDARVVGHVRVLPLADGSQVSCNLDVPLAQLDRMRRSVRFRLKGDGGGGSLLGSPGKSEDELRAILVKMYGSRLQSLDGQPVGHSWCA